MDEERTSPIAGTATETTPEVEQNSDIASQNNDLQGTNDVSDTSNDDTCVSPGDSDSSQPEIVAEPVTRPNVEEAEVSHPTDSSEQDAEINSSALDMATHMGDKPEQEDIHPSIEAEEELHLDDSQLNTEAASPAPDAARGESEGEESSSHHEGTDEDVFTDKSPRSSMGSYDAGSESGKKIEGDNMTTITSRSPRISDISQYDQDEDFIPTARGTPRPPFRTPSDVRAMQMSSPTSSVHGSPRSSRKYLPTVSRLGTPSASAQYSPKGKSTPPRFKSRQEAPLVLLHVTLLPLRWMWGDVVNTLDPADMTEQAKTLRDSWRILQDRVGDTVIERGILLGHPQNDYEVLEERLLEALDLPVRRRARILECGHYLGPSNEATLTEDEESEDDFGQDRRRSASKRHWCATCKSEIRYDNLGEAKIFRVKVYASNGLMRAGAWEACWKEMERVDVEIEPIVEPGVQDEIVRLAAAQQEREIAQQEEAEIAKEVALQYEEHRRSEERLLLQAQMQAQAQSRMSSPLPPQSEPATEQTPEFVHEHVRESRSPSRRQRDDEERLREIYGQTPPPPESEHPDTSHHHQDSYIPPPSPRSPSEEANERREKRRRGYQSATLPELLLKSMRVLMQDRKNVVIITLSVFVLMLALRSASKEPSYDATLHELKAVPEIQQPPVDVTQSVIEHQEPIESHSMQPIVTMSSVEAPQEEYTASSIDAQDLSSTQDVPHSETAQASLEPGEVASSQPPMNSVASEPTAPSIQETPTTSASVSKAHNPCKTTAKPTTFVEALASSVEPEVSEVETVEEVETATVTEKKIVKVVRTVTETQTQTETQTEVETATAFETIKVMATAVPQPKSDSKSHVEADAPDSSADTIVAESITTPEAKTVDMEAATTESAAVESVFEPEPEPDLDVESVDETICQPSEDDDVTDEL